MLYTRKRRLLSSWLLRLISVLLNSDFMNGWIPRFLSRVLKQCDGADGANAASGEPKTCFVDVRPEGANNCRKQGDSPDVIGHPKVRCRV